MSTQYRCLNGLFGIAIYTIISVTQEAKEGRLLMVLTSSEMWGYREQDTETLSQKETFLWNRLNLCAELYISERININWTLQQKVEIEVVTLQNTHRWEKLYSSGKRQDIGVLWRKNYHIQHRWVPERNGAFRRAALLTHFKSVTRNKLRTSLLCSVWDLNHF